MENDTAPSPTTSPALELRLLLDVLLLEHGLSWKHERVKRWMKAIEPIVGHPIKSPADLPLEALFKLIDNLDQCQEETLQTTHGKAPQPLVRS